MADLQDNLFTYAGFEKYSRLVGELFAHACELAICNAEGVPVLASPRMDTNNLVSDVVLPLGEVVVTEKVQSSRLNGSKTLYSLGMATENDESLGILVLLVDHESLPEGVNPRMDFNRLVKNIAACIMNESAMTQELNSMAHELADRYEELNLVYETDSHTQERYEVHRSLDRIVKNCMAYLGVDMVFLNLPGKKISICHNNMAMQDSEMQVISENAGYVLFQLLKESKSSVVLNKIDDVQEICPDMSCKILSSPIFAGADEITGILVTAKNRQAPDYTNSDRNLLDVMSKKIMQILHENYDVLTGLLNRAAYKYYIEKSLSSARDAGMVNVVLDIDLDDLHVINETFNYLAGDALIRKISGVIQDMVCETCAVSRIDGDKFGVLLENVSLEAGVQLANNIRQRISGLGFVWDGRELDISATIGVAIIDEDTESCTSIISEAEVARDAAKELGRDLVHVFHRGNDELIRRKKDMQWVDHIKTALREDRFVIYGQPIIPLQSSAKRSHIEVLLRLQNEDGSILAPGAFMPAAERYHLMPEIDRWVVNRTLTVLSEQAGAQIGVAINLSGQSFCNENFLDFVVERLNQVNFPLEEICFEVTESAAISNLAEAKYFMSVLKEKGCRFSLDDFGSGLSSFSYLKNLPVDYLKIDGSFVKDILDDPISEAMVSAINQVGQVMGLETIAEFVENDAIRIRLMELGINYAQGYGIGKPSPFVEQLKGMSQ